MVLSFLLFISITLSFLDFLQQTSSAAQDGWRMVDRFFGFRYEVKANLGGGSSQGDDIGSVMKSIQSKADDLGCFGWVQENTARQSLVGEVRCSKAKGPMMQEYLDKVGPTGTGQFLVYPDTKIRLHFSHFKIVEQSRDTCFLDMPHKCPDLDSATSPDHTGASTSAGAGKDEL
jgi:hypothetical protein